MISARASSAAEEIVSHYFFSCVWKIACVNCQPSMRKYPPGFPARAAHERGNTFKREDIGSNLCSATIFLKSRFVAQSSAASGRTLRDFPVRSHSPLAAAEAVWSAFKRKFSYFVTRKMVPPIGHLEAAIRSARNRSRNAPFCCPNSSLSSKPVRNGRAVSDLTNGFELRGQIMNYSRNQVRFRARSLHQSALSIRRRLRSHSSLVLCSAKQLFPMIWANSFP